MSWRFKTVLIETAAAMAWLAAASLPARAQTACLAPPSGLVSWWPGDANENDIAGTNNPNGVSGVTLVPGEVSNGLSLRTNGYIQVPASSSLANPNFTWAAWVKPTGPGPNNDADGSTIAQQDIDDYNLSVALYWRSSDSRFVFIFGNSTTEIITSKDAFPTGSFYHLAATYDGAVFRLYVNGIAEGTYTETKKVPYSTIAWTVGSSGPAGIAIGYPRTFVGIIDELQAFNRALSQSELQSIFAAGAAGECKNAASQTPAAPQSAAQTPSFIISTIAGNGLTGYSGDGGQATSAALDDPRGIVTDPSGNVYFCDRENNVVRKISTNGVITTIAGTGVAGYNGDNIPATKAELNTPWRVTIDPAGNLYIADSVNDRIRKLTTNGIITTVVGNGQPGYSGDGGAATSATLRIPEQAELDVFGNLYIADSGNNVIRKVDTNGNITTVAGTGFGAGVGNSTGTGAYSGDGGPAIKAQLNLPVSIALDPAGDLWISDQENNIVREVNNSGIINTVAGVYNKFGYTGDGGPAAQATFNGPAGIARDAAGNIYVTDYGNNVLRVLLTDNSIRTVAGNGKAGFAGDGGPSTQAELYSLRQVAVGTFGDVFIADSLNNRIRKLTPVTTTLGETTNAAGNIQVLAANTWLTIKGTNLAPDTRLWQTSDFVNGQMPTSLDGVSVTINGVNAYVDYISPTQVNALAPPTSQPGVVQVQVINNGTKSAPASVELQSYSTTFFTFNGGPYIAAVHANGAIIGPTTLFPGASTPAQRGETIQIYGNGFGPTTVPVAAGSSVQSGTLPVMPTITVGGVPATVTFAGLISPGLYQFNIVVPSTVTPGDNAIVATYSGFTTQPGVVLTVQ